MEPTTTRLAASHRTTAAEDALEALTTRIVQMEDRVLHGPSNKTELALKGLKVELNKLDDEKDRIDAQGGAGEQSVRDRRKKLNTRVEKMHSRDGLP